MASRMTKGFIAIFIIIIGLLVVNFRYLTFSVIICYIVLLSNEISEPFHFNFRVCSINVDLSKVVHFALDSGVNHKQNGNQTKGLVLP
jgi:signal transduction histidine kinase